MLQAPRRRALTTWFCFFFTALLCSLVCADDTPGFREALHITPLQDGRVHAFFSFSLNDAPAPSSTSSTAKVPMYSTVPRPLVHLASASDAEEVHLAINAGRWDYAKWGYPTGEEAVGTGAEVWAHIAENQSASTVQSNETLSGISLDDSIHPRTFSRWRTLTANMAGLFCASLDALDERVTVKPWRGYGSQIASEKARSTILHATLSSEAVCTENLSPLLKLLPCKTTAGLSSLLEPHRFFSSDFHGMALHIVRVGDGWDITINIQAVFSPVMLPGLRGKRDWSLHSIFGRKLDHSCPLADDSYITVRLPPSPYWLPHRQEQGRRQDEVSSKTSLTDGVDNSPNFVISPILVSADMANAHNDDDEGETESSRYKRFERAFIENIVAQGEARYDTRNAKDLDVQMIWPAETEYSFPHTYSSPKFSAARTLKGSGQERGTVEVTLRNDDATREKTIVYFDVLPWFVKPYLHSLKAVVDADDFEEEADDVVRYADDVTASPLVSLHYSPSVPRSRPFHIEAGLRVPPQSTVRLSFDYDKAFLRYAEHPPDAHRGFDLAPAVFLPVDKLHLGKGRPFPRLYSTPGLVEVAVPDFSMPYNVIIFTSTIMALCAGSTLNNLIRKYTDVVT